jgi:UDP-N-acetylglucosamine transferase subunit ALG13
MHFQGFDRLVRAADELAKGLNEKVLIQYGNSSSIPQYAEGFAWKTGDEMEYLMQEARVIVAHAAVGSIIPALKNGKPLVVAPGMKLYNEVIDDHQQQLCKILEVRGKVVSVEDLSSESLRTAIYQAGKNPPLVEEPTQLVQALRELLASWERNV